MMHKPKPYIVEAFAYRHDEHGRPGDYGYIPAHWNVTTPRKGGRLLFMTLRINRAVRRALGDSRMGHVRITVEWLGEISDEGEEKGGDE